jgi:hypothetical protein
MKYHIVIWYVPDIKSDNQIPFIDEEWDSEIDIATLSTATDEFIQENK